MTAISVSERLLEMAAFYTPLALTVTFFLTQTLTPTGAGSGKVYTARDRILPIVCAALSWASVVTWA